MELEFFKYLLFLGTLLLLVFLPQAKKKYTAIAFLVGSIIISASSHIRFIAYYAPILLIFGLVITMYLLKRDNYIWLYLLVTPVIFGFILHYSANYAGVVNPFWPYLIISLIMVPGMFLTARKNAIWKIIISGTCIVIAILTMVLCQPNYTFTEARDKLAQEISKEIYPANEEQMNIIHTVPKLSFCIDYAYIFDSDTSTYIFNPVNGVWTEKDSRPE